MNGCVVHWDYENCPVPRGVTVSFVLNDMRRFLHEAYGVILSAYVYADSQKLSSPRRQEMAACGLDVIDCSRESGKMNTVDFRIVTRALAELARPTGNRPAVVIVTGDGDFCYTMSTLRNVGVRTQLIFDSDRRGVVNSVMLQTVESAHGISFGGHDPDAPHADAFSVEENGAGSDVHVLALDDTEGMTNPSHEDILLLAIERAPQADNDGFKSATSVGELFHRLRNADEPTKALRQSAFRAAKGNLMARGKVEVRTGEHHLPLLRIVPSTQPTQ